MKKVYKSNSFIICLLFFLCSTTLYGQDRTVSGQVIDAEANEPLPGVNVLVKGTGQGTITDLDGRFRLQVPEERNTLVFSFVGYLQKEVNIQGQTTVNVDLSPDVETLAEVVVVGYGEQRKSLLTGAISSVNAEQLSTVSNMRVDQALQGRIAGVNVLPASGSPGAGMQVRIRGVGSNGRANPLFIVDGVRTADIDFLDPNEIASVEVLKDAASAAIYGAEGANGVVIVSTKKGKKGVTTIDYNGQYGLQSVNPRMSVMNAQQYVTYLQEAGATQGPAMSDITDPVGTNWFDEVFQIAPMQRHTLNFSGGSETSTFFLGGSVFTQDGVIGGDQASFDRYSGRLNTSHRIKDWLTVGNNLTYSHLSRSTIAEDSEYGSVIGNIIGFDPVTPVVYPGNALPPHLQEALGQGHTLLQNSAGLYYGISPYLYGEFGNPLAQLSIMKGNNIQDRVVGNVYADIEPIEGFKFTTRLNLDAGFGRFQNWTPTYYFSPERLNTTPSWNGNQSRRVEWQWENFATYTRKFGNHNVTGLLGTSAIAEDFQLLGGSAAPLFAEEGRFAYPDYIPDASDRVNGYRAETALHSYFGRVGYDYNGTYLVNLTVRRDGSSKLHPNNRWGTFPSASVGWVLSNEEFFPETFVSFFKVRASWGENGSIANLGIGQYASVITTQGMQYPTQNGFLTPAEPAFLANPELVWETSEQVDIGVDLGFFEERLTLTADYFNRTTKDLLTLGSPPDLVGNNPSFVNGGNVRNQGVELELNFRERSGDFSYEIGGNITAIRNEVTYLNPLIPRLPGAMIGGGWTATWFEEGLPIWYFRGYETAGVFRDQAHVNTYLSENDITGYDPQPGDPIVVDVNDDGVITPDDQTYIGDPHPDFVFGGRINLRYKGFDFLLFAQGQTGNDILMGFNRTDKPTVNRPAFFYEERWTEDNPNADWFRAETASPYAYNSDFMVFDGSYVRIRQLQLGYTLPESLLNTIGFGRARVYVSLDDYFTFTKYPGLDPEAGSNNVQSLGIDRGVYPVPRKLMTGLSLNF